MEETVNLKVGDKLITTSSYGWGGKDIYYSIHVIEKITPTGRIKTDRQLSLNPDLSIRGENYSRVTVSLPSEKLYKAMNMQVIKADTKKRLSDLDIDKLNEEDLNKLCRLLREINTN